MLCVCVRVCVCVCVCVCVRRTAYIFSFFATCMVNKEKDEYMTYRLHAALVSPAKVMLCIQCCRTHIKGIGLIVILLHDCYIKNIY